MKFLSTLFLLGLLLTGCNSQAMLVEKQAFEIASFNTENGALISPVRVGWEAYGKLNADKSNVVLITHFFSGSSHAAGKYSESDAAAGYWDATGKPYGLTFPVVTIGDFVEVQKALLDSLGIDKLHAVVGGSMGSFQAIEWATRYPDRVARLIPVIGTAYIDAWAAVRLERWAYPIKQDPAWRGGNYYQHGQPEHGLTTALAYIIQDAVYPTGFNMRYPAPETDKAPHLDILASFSAWDQLMAHAKIRAKMQDANHILYLVRASQLYRAGMGDNWQQALGRVKFGAI